MTTPLRKLRVSDAEWNAWKAAAPNGNVSGWLRSLAEAALTQIDSGAQPRTPEVSAPLAPVVRVHAPPRDPEWVRREAALLASLNEEA